MKQIKLSTIAAAFLTTAVLFSGCSLDDEDKIVETFNGTVVDGYISNAKVYYDGYKDEFVTTDEDGKFELSPKRNLSVVVESNSSTINMTTYASYQSTLSAPAGYNTITPLTTILNADSQYGEKIAELNHIEYSDLVKYLDQDPIDMMDDLDENTSNIGATIYATGVFIEEVLNLLMIDSNSAEPSVKQKASKAIFDYILNNNKTLIQLGSTDYENIYVAFKTLENKTVNNNTKERIGIVGKDLSSNLGGLTFTKSNSINFEKELAKNDIFEMLTTDDNIEIDNVKLKSSVISLGIAASTSSMETDDLDDKSSLLAVSANTILSQLKIGNQNPSVIVPALLDINSSEVLEHNETLSFIDEDNATVTYTAVIDENDFLTFASGSRFAFNQSANEPLRLKINKDKMDYTDGVVINITPKDKENIVGDTISMLVLVRKELNIEDNANLASVRRVIAEGNFTDCLTISAENYRLKDDDKVITYTETDSTLLFVHSFDNDVVAVSKEKKNITITPVYNGTAKVVKVSLTDNYIPVIEYKTITIEDMDLLPLMSTDKSSFELIETEDGNDTKISLSYVIYDPDSEDTSFNLNIVTSNSSITCDTVTGAEKNKDGNIVCTLADGIAGGTYNITATVNDGKLDGSVINYTIKVEEGNVAPTLSLISDSTIDIATMSSKTISYSADDLNGLNTIKVNVNSNDETVVKVSIDEENQNITIYGQPKVGTATITIQATDDHNETSPERTIIVNTLNEMTTLISNLRAVPISDVNGTLYDSRYEITNFGLSYSMTDNSIDMSADINITDTYNISNLILDAYPEESLFGAIDGEYGIAIKNDFGYQGSFFDGRVLAFTTQDVNETANVPFYWALATPEEICSANYSDVMMTLINNSNLNEVDCSQE